MHAVPAGIVLTRDDLRAVGWSDAAIGRALRSGRLVAVRRGVFTVADVDGRTRSLAVARACQGGVVSHRSALVLHGLPLVGSKDHLPELTVAPNGRGSVAHAHLHRATLRTQDVCLVAGVPVTSIARTLVDVARHRSMLCSVAALDAALHAQRVTYEELDDVLRLSRNWPRVRRAHRAVRLADRLAESPLESVSRLVIKGIGLPAPLLQRRFYDEFGVFLGRADFYWPDPGVIGEADGRGKYDGRDVLTAEKDRQERLENPGIVVTRWGWDDALYRRQLLRSRIEQAFRRGEARDRSGSPRLWSVRDP